MDDLFINWLRMLDLPAGVRLRLLHSEHPTGAPMSFKDGHRWWSYRRWIYKLWSWRGKWTWGVGFDREGVGVYLGPLSFWIIWSGR